MWDVRWWDLYKKNYLLRHINKWIALLTHVHKCNEWQSHQLCTLHFIHQDLVEQILWSLCISQWLPVMAGKQPFVTFFNCWVGELVPAFEYDRTPALNDWVSAGNRFDLCDSLTASMGVALIIPLLNSCFLAQPGSCPGIKQWAKS